MISSNENFLSALLACMNVRAARWCKADEYTDLNILYDQNI
jgi:hypothetical protein